MKSFTSFLHLNQLFISLTTFKFLQKWAKFNKVLQDIAKFCLRALQIPQTKNQTFLLSGSKGWVSSEIINLCEQLAGQQAKVQQVPLFLLKFIKLAFLF